MVAPCIATSRHRGLALSTAAALGVLYTLGRRRWEIWPTWVVALLATGKLVVGLAGAYFALRMQPAYVLA